MKRYIMVVPYIDGVASSNYEATAADIAEAHERCMTCSHCEYDPIFKKHMCDNEQSPSYARRVDPALDYCRHHPELNQPKETT